MCIILIWLPEFKGPLEMAGVVEMQSHSCSLKHPTCSQKSICFLTSWITTLWCTSYQWTHAGLLWPVHEVGYCRHSLPEKTPIQQLSQHWLSGTKTAWNIMTVAAHRSRGIHSQEICLPEHEASQKHSTCNNQGVVVLPKGLSLKAQNSMQARRCLCCVPQLLHLHWKNW